MVLWNCHVTTFLSYFVEKKYKDFKKLVRNILNIYGVIHVTIALNGLQFLMNLRTFCFILETGAFLRRFFF